MDYFKKAQRILESYSNMKEELEALKKKLQTLEKNKSYISSIDLSDKIGVAQNCAGQNCIRSRLFRN